MLEQNILKFFAGGSIRAQDEDKCISRLPRYSVNIDSSVGYTVKNCRKGRLWWLTLVDRCKKEIRQGQQAYRVNIRDIVASSLVLVHTSP